MYNTIIEIEAWGDFQMRYTDCIMASEERLDVKALVRQFCSMEGLPGESGNDSDKLGEINEKFRKFLKKSGFVQLKTKKVCFSD